MHHWQGRFPADTSCNLVLFCLVHLWFYHKYDCFLPRGSFVKAMNSLHIHHLISYMLVIDPIGFFIVSSFVSLLLSYPISLFCNINHSWAWREDERLMRVKAANAGTSASVYAMPCSCWYNRLSREVKLENLLNPRTLVLFLSLNREEYLLVHSSVANFLLVQWPW